MKWLVLEDNPKPDNYIGIIALRDEQKVDLDESTAYTLYHNRKEAVSRAFALKERYQVRGIRIFFSEGHSKNVS